MWVFVLLKRQNGECNVWNLRRFLFGMSLDCTGIQSPRFYKWSKRILVVDILTQILFTLLTFTALTILRKIMICHRWFLFGVSHINFQLLLKEWSMDNSMVSKIWVGMSATNIHLFLFQIQSHSQKRGDIRTHSEEKPSKIPNITFANLLFSQNNPLVKLLCTLGSTSLDEIIRGTSFVNLKCVT